MYSVYNMYVHSANEYEVATSCIFFYKRGCDWEVGIPFHFQIYFNDIFLVAQSNKPPHRTSTFAT